MRSAMPIRNNSAKTASDEAKSRTRTRTRTRTDIRVHTVRRQRPRQRLKLKQNGEHDSKKSSVQRTNGHAKSWMRPERVKLGLPKKS